MDGHLLPKQEGPGVCEASGPLFYSPKWDAVGCIELPDLDGEEDTETIGQLAEIAENLHRREIDAIERGELIAAWSRIRGERKDKVAQVGPLKEPGKGRGSTGGIRKAARDLGVARQTVE